MTGPLVGEARNYSGTYLQPVARIIDDLRASLDWAYGVNALDAHVTDTILNLTLAIHIVSMQRDEYIAARRACALALERIPKALPILLRSRTAASP